MSVNNKDIALSVIHFLKQSVSKNEIPEDYAESMDVAIDCIADAFEVNKDDDAKTVEAKFAGKSLAELLNNSGNTNSSKDSTAAAAKEVDAATKEKADGLKSEGNKAMANKNFSEAIEKYTAAIELDGSNVVYLSNRAAAYSSSSQHENAVKDAEKAIELNPNFSKSYSRLGLAKYALGDATAAMKAYEKGLEVEGDKKSDAMTKGFETAKRRVEEELEKSIPQSSVSTTESDESNTRSAGAGAGAGTGSGLPDFGSMFGGNGGGMPSFAEMMNNPQLMQAAQSLMSDPNAMQNLMSNPAIRQMAENFGGSGGSGPDLSNLMNNPMLQNLAGQFMGGNNNNNNNNSGGSGQN